jgi:2'-5' RNA ligase
VIRRRVLFQGVILPEFPQACAFRIEDFAMPRLFTGLEIPAEIGQTLSNLRGGLPGARWIDPENYHVTLRFIGDIDGVAANEIASMLFRVNRKPFEVALQGLSSFGGRKPRAVVASIVPSRPLIELQAELERLMQRFGLDPEGRKFTPHVTLARLRDASNQDVADYLSVRGYFPTRVFTASRFVLFSSRASTGGGPYVVEDSYALSA